MHNQTAFSPPWRKQLINSVCFIIIIISTITLVEKVTHASNLFLKYLHPITAFNFIISSLALYLLRDPIRSRLSLILCTCFAFIVALMSCTTLMGGMHSFNHIDSTLYENLGFSIKEPLSININFILISIGLLVSAWLKNTKFILLWTSYTIFMISIFSLFQFTYMVRQDYVLTEITKFSPVLVILFILYSAALALTNPTEKYINILINDSIASKYARKILIYIITIPIIISYVENVGERYHLYDPDFGDSMLSTFSMLLIMVITVIGIRKIQDEENIKNDIDNSLQYITYNDPALGSLNRRGFISALDETISLSPNKKMMLLKISINQIDLINYVIGFEATNLLLRELIERYKKSSTFNQAIIGRLDQYMFGFFVDITNYTNDITTIVNSLLEITSEPSTVNGKEIILTSSVGISLYPEDGGTSEQLLKGAYAALLEAKKQSGNSFYFFSHSLANMIAERLTIETDLQAAIAGNQLQLYYQPQLDLKTGLIAGAEILLRWFHPQKGLVNPAVFIPIAEETELVLPIGEWIISEACRQIKKGIFVHHGRTIPLAINVSAKQFKNKYNIASVFERYVHAYHIKTSSIEIEVTESVFLFNIHHNLKYLTDLKQMGFNITLDDFGTGYSSFNYLSQIPSDKIKIDKFFIDRIQQAKDMTLVTAIIAMAHALGKKVVAEGVENREQFLLLKDKGCDYIQGNYYSPALSLTEFKKFIKK